MGKISYEHRVYESVADKSSLEAISQNLKEKIRAQMG